MGILVTGGAGYIGSIAVKQLISKGYEVVVIDNLSKGKKELVDEKAVFYQVDLIDKDALSKVFENHKIDTVIHFAAYKSVEESMKNPIKYSDNIIGTINLLNLMIKHKVKKIIYSSSAAVYSIPKNGIVNETNETKPINFYGSTKLICEQLIREYAKNNAFKYIILRYFNVAGDSGLNYVDPDAENIFPIIMEYINGKRKELVIFGDDYDTPDGTCVRDYIDVNDLVKAHILALNLNESSIINLGTSKGVSVKELINEFSKVTGKNIDFSIGPRRKGDPAMLIASNEKAKAILGWVPEKNINDMIQSTYEVYKNND